MTVQEYQRNTEGGEDERKEGGKEGKKMKGKEREDGKIKAHTLHYNIEREENREGNLLLIEKFFNSLTHFDEVFFINP